jgi:hypothetical protein
MKPDDFRRQFPELAEGRCAFSGALVFLTRVAVAAVCDARDLMGEVGLAEGVSSVALLL